jgi:pimeloyl-ACP methyl ester carboxylesterase
MPRILTFLIMLACSLAWGQSRPIQRELLRVPTRKGVTQLCLLNTEGPTAPLAIALMLPGGQGVVDLGRRSMAEVFRREGTFLVRSADLFLTPELAVGILDAPSDQTTGMDDGFRASDRHAQDLAAVVALLRTRFPGVKVCLVGTSRGTVSAAYAGAAMGSGIDGLVLTSTVFQATKRNPGLSLFPFERLKAPVLFVHHAEDGCPACPYEAAVKAAKGALVTVRGGREPESGPCDPLSNHGYFGREAPVAQAIRAWILGRPFEAEVR